MDPGQLKQHFTGLLTALISLLGLPSYNGSQDEEQPAASSPVQMAATDCLQAICNLLGPGAYLSLTAQLYMTTSSTGKEAIHLAEVN